MPEFEFFECHLVLDYDEYWFEVEEYRRGDDRLYMAHIWFEKFSPSIYKRVLREWRAFRQAVPVTLFALCDDGDFDKWKHFVTSLGFRPTEINVPCNNGEIRQLFISTPGEL